MAKIIRLTESDLVRLVNKVIKEQKSFTKNVDTIPCIKNNFIFPIYKVTDRQILSKFQGKVSGTPVLSDKNVILLDRSRAFIPEKATIIANGNPVGTFDLRGTSLQDEIDTITFVVYHAQPEKSKFKIGWVLCNDGLYLYDIYGEQQQKLEKN